jgi:hypothetical protein
LSPEDPFPKQGIYCDIDVIGRGKDWSGRGPIGSYYAPQEIECKTHQWDSGYAFMEPDRKRIHLKFYWVSPPNKVIPSDISGCYLTTKKSEADR